MQQAFGFQRGQRFIPTAKAGGFRAVFCGNTLDSRRKREAEGAAGARFTAENQLTL